jgi:hypothetical protein
MKRLLLIVPLSLAACVTVPADTTPIQNVPAAPAPIQIAIAPVPSPPPLPNIDPAPSPAEQFRVPEDVAVISSVLSEVSKTLSLGGDAIRRETATTNAAWLRVRTESLRMKLALLVAYGSTGPVDDQRALSLLEPWLAKNGEPSLYRALAEVIAVPIQEKYRLMREEQKRSEGLKDKLDTTQKQLDAANQKLDALRQLERSLSGRRTP